MSLTDLKENDQETTPAETPAAAPSMAALDDLQAQETRQLAETVTLTGTQKKAADLQKEAELAAARAGAAMAMGFVETMVKMSLPYIEVQDETRAALVDKTAAVLAKHGGGFPEWLLPYREEVELGMTLASAGFGVWMQVQAHKVVVFNFEQEKQRREQGQNNGRVDLSTEQKAA